MAKSVAAQGEPGMYGLISKLTTGEGKRDAVLEILLQDVGPMPGCLSYVVAKDPADPDAIWITEVWDSQESHTESLKNPAVQSAIDRTRPMIASFGEHFVTTPVGGHGLHTL